MFSKIYNVSLEEEKKLIVAVDHDEESKKLRKSWWKMVSSHVESLVISCRKLGYFILFMDQIMWQVRI